MITKTGVAIVVVLSISGIVLGQGSLVPPVAPAPTMKSLEQIEPRSPISSVPITITQSGSYYLTSNLISVTGINGITVDADDVTIDLNGFSLVRSGLAGGSGIFQDGGYRNLRVCNGKVIDWTAGSNAGINARGENNAIDLVQASGNKVGISGGAGVRIMNCSAYENDSYGIYGGLNSSITRCVSFQNKGTGIFGYDGSSIFDCNAYSNVVKGIQVLRYVVVRNCSSMFNQDDNIHVVGYCQVCNNHSKGSTGGAGIHIADVSSFTGEASRIESNTVQDNHIGIHVENDRNLIVRNSAGGNGINYFVGKYNENKVGKIINPPDCTAISGDTGGGFGLGAGDATFRPWVNFVTEMAVAQ